MWSDAVLTLTLYPFVLAAFAAVTVGCLFVPLAHIMPIVFAALAMIVSDFATRDIRANTIPCIRSAPRLREGFVWWKLGSTLLFCLLFCAAPISRTALLGAAPLSALLGGIVFVASIATSLGVMTTNSKTFIVTFLSFWYLVINDHGANRWLDVGGLYGSANIMTTAAYIAVSAIAIACALLLHRVRLARD